jgi:hypothetical protein
MSEEDEGLFDDVPLANRERDRAFEAFIKRKDVKAMFSDGFPFPLNRGYYDFWCIVWAKAWDKGFHAGWEQRGKHDKERKPANVHDKFYSEFDLANAYQKGWDDALLRSSIGPRGRT